MGQNMKNHVEKDNCSPSLLDPAATHVSVPGASGFGPILFIEFNRALFAMGRWRRSPVVDHYVLDTKHTKHRY